VAQIPSRIFEIVQQLKEDKKPKKVRVRKVLKWFGAARRGTKIIAEIEEVLGVAGLDTEPPFSEAGIDDRVQFALRSANASTGVVSAKDKSIEPEEAFDETGIEEAGAVATLPKETNGGGYFTSPDHLEPEAEELPTQAAADDRPVSSQPHDWTISTIREKWNKGQLDLQPAYQREYVWKLRPELPSRLIESLLLEIPIPPIYFGKIPGGRLEVIDGQQRLTTLISFINNEFELKRLEAMGSLNGKKFCNLSEEQQAKIFDAAIRSVVIDSGNNADLRYEIFERLNRGSMALNEQELRNCVYRGPFNDLLAELEKYSYWRKIRGTPSPDPRFVEREIILRVFAFINRFQFYAGNLKRFLNEYMKSYAPNDSEQIQEQAEIFRQTAQNIYSVFGAHSARLYSVDEKSNKGSWDAKFSVAALDIQVSALVGKNNSKVQACAEQLRELYLFLLLTDPMLRTAIETHTGGTTQTKYRWTVYKNAAEQIVDGQILEPRFFDLTFRQKLFKQSPICKICGNQIHSFEDSTVDHIHPHSKGGKTVEENGQLAHRTCNARKNAALLV
jgi:Protein of unknown function DUF262/HNH endonuclease